MEAGMVKKCASREERKAHHPEKIKKAIADRLSRIEGQIRGVRRMIDEDIYCDNVINQVTSIQAALNGVSILLLEHHVKSCVVDQIIEGKTEVIDELMKTIARMSK
jgi:CsoR family transcriptional regulator, copper-sensing transcriptional repressor